MTRPTDIRAVQWYGTRAMQFVTNACRTNISIDEIRLVEVRKAIQVLQQLEMRLEVQLEADLAIDAARRN